MTYVFFLLELLASNQRTDLPSSLRSDDCDLPTVIQTIFITRTVPRWDVVNISLVVLRESFLNSWT